MDTSDIKNFSKILCEIIMKRDRKLFNNIQEVKLSAVPNPSALSDNLMEILRNKLIEWEIDVECFEILTSKENSLATMNYLIETIQSDAYNENEKLKKIKEILNKNITSIDSLYTCVKIMECLLIDLKTMVSEYNFNIERRVNITKSLTDFASDIYDILCKFKTKLNSFDSDDIISLDSTLNNFMQQLLELSIVIGSYPPRTVKKGTPKKVGTQFKVIVKCLIESEKLFSREDLKAYFLTEGDFRNYVATDELMEDCILKYVLNNFKSNIWELKNILWSPSERQAKERPRSDRITNQKSIIMVKFKACANPYLFGQFNVNTCLFSDTTVSIVHTNQEIDAHITLFWDDYFRQNRTNFLVTGVFHCKDSVLIGEFVEAVSRYFEKETCRGLSLSNKEFLSTKLSKITNGRMSLNQFSSQIMPDSSVSVGNWFLSIVKLLKIPGVFDLWKDGFIDGFMRKDDESLFCNCSAGTFSLRFSERNSKIGVVIKTPYNNLEAWNPFSADECRNRNLCERLMEFHELQYFRKATGDIVKKEEALSTFIPDKHTDFGYTERGQLSRILCSNIYLDNIMHFDDNEDPNETDMFIGITLDNDVSMGQ